MRRFTYFIAACSGVFLWAHSAQARNDIITVTDANGNVINDVNGNPASAAIQEGTAAGVLLEFAVPDPAPMTGVGLIETAGGLPDGVGQVRSIVGTAVGFFGEDFAINCAVTTCLPETGQLQDVTSLIFPGVVAPFRVLVQADVAVPEPGTSLLLGFGLTGLVAMGARRRHA